MELWMLIFCVMPTFVTSVTILSNGNSPETKMTRHIMSESNNPIITRSNEAVKYKANKSNKINSTKLGINERYRRLIPYMTFYYANDIATPSPVPEQDQEKSVEVDKAEIIETGNINPSQREERVIHSFLRQKNIPRYQGNRLTYHNIASANPSKYVKEVLPTFYQPSNKFTPNYNPLFVDHNIYPDREREYEKFIVKPIKAPSAPFSHQTRKPFLNFDQNNDANVHYYLSEKEVAPKYKLVPYDQTPPIKTFQQYENVESIKQYVPVQAQKDPVYIKPRQKPTPPQFFYIHENEQYRPKKPPTTISEMYYEKQTAAPLAEPIIESGFHPIIPSRPQTTESPLQYTREYHQPIPKLERPPEDVAFRKPSYQYVLEESSYISKPTHNENTKTASLADLLNSLQINKSIPKPITKDNISASINTLLQVLNALKAQQNQIESPVLSTPKPFAVPDSIVKTTPKPLLHNTVESPSQDIHFEEPYLAQVNSPSQHLDDYPSSGSSQQFPQPIYSDEEGGTPGRPGVDYPILTIIPPTKFDCKTQRYKGFFADPETRCQVWHYCDLNGGQASFLCPNGTIFSQAGLTCDWWFNVRCASTPQLYVLNESLYKFILPHSPKFPEDYSGPLVDKYLTLKFKEMEEQFKKNKSKNKQTASEKIDDEEDTKDAKSSEETSTDSKSDTEDRTLNNAAVIIESAGSSGNVERLQE